MKNARIITLAACLAAAGCASHATAPLSSAAPAPAPASPASPAAMDHGMHAGHDMSAMPAMPATAGPGYTEADVRFMQHMIGHHAQAIIMAAKAPSHGASDNVRKLAQKIDISQRDEIVFMKQWLGDRKQVIPGDSQSLAMEMPGMITSAQMAQLEAARSSDFDRLFLRFMIGHHEGALTMVDELFDAPRAGQDSEIFRFATDVDADQRDEIYVMQQLLYTIQ